MSNEKSTTELKNFKPFDALSETSYSLLERGLRYAQYAQSSVILEKGQAVSGSYIVVSGQLRVFTVTPKGNEATLYLINPGECCVLALNCIFNDLRYPAWVEASPATKVAVINGKLYRTLFDTEAAIRNMTVQTFSSLAFLLMDELEGMHSYKLEQRLANLLLTRASSDGIVRMTQQEMASHLGSTREVIARIIRQFVSQQHIESSRNRIMLNNPAALAAMVKSN